MKLAVDIGNTSISICLFEKNKIFKKSYFNSTQNFIDFMDKNTKQYDIQLAIISSVAPQLSNKLTDILLTKYNISNTHIDYKSSNLDLQVPYPETVGVDRLCNMFAVQRDYSTPAIIIDFGTATTYDVINRSNQFIGGVIAAGVETSAKYLINKAALLSDTDLIFPENVIGIDTKTNIQSGIMFGSVDQVEGMIRRIYVETKTEYSIILTGGFAKLISPKLSYPHIVDQDLTLKGIIYIDGSNN